MITGIEHIAVCSKDTTILKDWYKRVFGFQQVYDNGKGTYFLRAPNGFMIEFIPETDPGEISVEKKGGIRHIALMTDDFVNMIQLLKKEKVAFITDPNLYLKATGALYPENSEPKLFFFRDPEGNILHLINRKQPLFFVP